MELTVAATPWRVLLLDRSDPADPHWLLATITLASDILPADLDPAGHYQSWAEVAQWVRDRLGHQIELRPMPDALAWAIRDARRTR